MKTHSAEETIGQKFRSFALSQSKLHERAAGLENQLKAVKANLKNWQHLLHILGEDLRARLPGWEVTMLGPCGLGCSVTVELKCGRVCRHVQIRPVRADHVSPDDGQKKIPVHDQRTLAFVSRKSTRQFAPNTLGYINGLNFPANEGIETVEQFLLKARINPDGTPMKRKSAKSKLKKP